MIPLPAPAALAAARPWGKPVRVATIELTQPSALTLRIADRYLRLSDYRNVVLVDLPVGYWRLGESSGVVALDEVGLHHGAYQGSPTLGVASLVPNNPGNTAMSTTNAANFMSVPHFAALAPSSTISVECWVNMTVGALRFVLRKGTVATYQFTIAATGVPRFSIRAGGVVFDVDGAALVTGTTYHLVGTYDGANARLYVNGVQVGVTAATGAITDDAGDLTIGAVGAFHVNGTIDDVAIYASVLSPTRILAHATPPTPAAADALPLVRSWGEGNAALNRLDAGGRPNTNELVVDNTRPIEGTSAQRFSDLVELYQFYGAKVTITELLDVAHSPAAAVPIGVYRLDEPEDMGQALLTLRMSDPSLLWEDAAYTTIITKGLFPQAPPASIDQELRVPFGTTPGVVFHPIVDGVAATLDGDIDASVTTIPLSADTDARTGSGTALIDAEEVTYTSRTPTALLGVTRGANATVASAHSSGARVFEILPAYIFAGAEFPQDFPLAALTAIKVNGGPARTSPTVELSGPSPVTGRRSARITFTPASVKDFHVYGAGNGVDVAVTDLSISLGTSGQVSATRTVAVPAGYEAAIPSRRTMTCTVTLTGGQSFSWNVERRVAGGAWKTIAGGVQGALPLNSPVTFSHTAEYTSLGNDEIRLNGTALTANGLAVTLAWSAYQIEHAPTGRSDDSTASRVIGTVTADIAGVTDAAGGPVSGTAGLLLTNPAHVSKFIHRYLMPGVGATDIGASFAASALKFAAAGYRWDFLLPALPYSRLREKLGTQSRSVVTLDAAGRVQHTFRLGVPTADLTLDVRRDVAASRPASVSRTLRTDVRNRLTAYSLRDPAKSDGLDSFGRVVVHQDLEQGLNRLAGATKDEPLPDTLELDFVRDANTARDLGEFELGWRKHQRDEVDLGTYRMATAAELADHLALTNHPTLPAGRIFSIRERRDDPSRGAITLVGVDASIDAGIGAGEALMAYGSRNLKAVNNTATPNSKIDVTADAIVLRNASNLIVIRHNPGSLTVDLTQAGPVANGRDQAGAFSASSWVHTFWMWDPTALILALIASATAPPTGPALPSGFSYWGYVDARRLDGSTNLVKAITRGSLVSRDSTLLITGNVSVNTEQSVDGSAVWPANAMAIAIASQVHLNAAGDTYSLRARSGIVSGPVIEAEVGGAGGWGGLMPIDSQTLYYIQSANAARAWKLRVDGYVVPNGGV